MEVKDAQAYNFGKLNITLVRSIARVILARGLLSIINCNISCLFDFFNGYFYIITIHEQLRF